MDTIVLDAIEPVARSFAAQSCADQALQFDVVFRRHFLISQQPIRASETWVSHTGAAIHISHCPDLPVVQLRDRRNKTLGWVLGIAVTGSGAYLDETEASGLEQADLEDFIEGLAGRFVVVTEHPTNPRLYLDPTSSMVAYFNPETGLVGSALALVLDRSPERTARTDGPLLFGDTSDRAVRRVTTNHFLDLASLGETRHWPRDDTDISVPENPTDTLDQVADRLTSVVGALVDKWRAILPVTGGTDSRFLLACAKPHLDKIASFYTHVQNGPSFVDTLIAASVCERLGVPHTSASIGSGAWRRNPAAIDAERALPLSGSYQLTTGRNVIVAAHAAQPHGDIMLRGGLIEMTRTNTWHPQWGDTPEQPIDPEQGIRATCHAIPVPAEYLEAQAPRYAAWMKTLPSHLLGRAPDFAVCELRVPTGNHVFYAAFPDPFLINPFSDRRMIHATLRLPYGFRRRLRPQNYVIRTRAPELRGVPYASRELKQLVGQSKLVELTGRRWR